MDEIDHSHSNDEDTNSLQSDAIGKFPDIPAQLQLQPHTHAHVHTHAHAHARTHGNCVHVHPFHSSTSWSSTTTSCYVPSAKSKHEQ